MATGAEIDALFRATLEGDYDDDAPWDSITKLRDLGTREVFERSVVWVQSEDSRLRLRGIDILAQLGSVSGHPETAFSDETRALVLETLERDQDPAIIDSCIIALRHVGTSDDIPIVLGFVSHPDHQVRHAVAVTLGSFSDDARSIEGLLTLIRDRDKGVRDWATFGLGSSAKPDSKEIRDAFVQRLRDRHRETREEAIAGLANRRDLRVLPFLIRELQRRKVSQYVIESACELLESPLPGRDDDWNADGLIGSLKARFPDELPSDMTP